MKPYYEQDGVTLYHGDCRELLVDMAADRMITDPVWPNPDHRLAGADDPYSLLREALSIMPLSVKTVVVQLGRVSDPRFLMAVPSRLPFICVSWLQYIPPSYSGRVLVDADVAYAFGEPVKSAPGRRVIPGGTVSTKGEMQRNHGKNRSHAAYEATQSRLRHPAPRHLAHVKWLVKWFSDNDDVIVDPFCGTGTTLLAAKEAHSKAIGIEIEERYCEIAARRLEQKVFAW